MHAEVLRVPLLPETALAVGDAAADPHIDTHANDTLPVVDN